MDWKGKGGSGQNMTSLHRMANLYKEHNHFKTDDITATSCTLLVGSLCCMPVARNHSPAPWRTLSMD